MSISRLCGIHVVEKFSRSLTILIFERRSQRTENFRTNCKIGCAGFLLIVLYLWYMFVTFAALSACGSYLYIYVKGIYNAQKTSKAVFVLVLMMSAGKVLVFWCWLAAGRILDWLQNSFEKWIYTVSILYQVLRSRHRLYTIYPVIPLSDSQCVFSFLVMLWA